MTCSVYLVFALVITGFGMCVMSLTCLTRHLNDFDALVSPLGASVGLAGPTSLRLMSEGSVLS